MATISRSPIPREVIGFETGSAHQILSLYRQLWTVLIAKSAVGATPIEMQAQYWAVSLQITVTYGWLDGMTQEYYNGYN